MPASTAPGARAICGAILVLLLLAGCGGEPPVAVGTAGAAADASTDRAPSALDDPRRVVLFLGDSLSAGAGLRSDQTFPAQVQRRIDDEGLPFRVVNAGVSGDTTAGGLRRIDWLLRQPVDTLVIQLGGNDMLRGQDIEAMRANLRGIADKTRAAYPDAALVVSGMRAMPNLGPEYAHEFEASFADLAAELDAAYIPFLLDGVAADAVLNQNDGIHPTAEGHRIVADTVWQVLAPLLRRRAQG